MNPFFQSDDKVKKAWKGQVIAGRGGCGLAMNNCYEKDDNNILSWINVVSLTRRTVTFVKREEPLEEKIGRVAELKRRQVGS